MALTAPERRMAKKSLGEEKAAVRDYTARRVATKSPALRKAFSHAIPEERTHYKLFMAALNSR